MTDRNVQFPNRYRLVPVPGTSGIYDLEPVPGEVSAEGTFLNKANLLSDETAAEIGLEQEDPTVNDALLAVYEKVRKGGGMNTFQAMMGGVGVQAYMF